MPGSEGTTAREGRPVSASMSSGDFTVLSRYSRKIARPIPPTRPTRNASRIFRAFCGRDGLVGRKRRIHHANVARSQAGRNPGFFQFLQQAVVELLVRFGIVLQDVVLHELFGQIVRFRLLLVERALQELDVAARRVVFLLDAVHHRLLRAGQIVGHFLLLRGQPLHLRKVRAVLVQRIRVRCVQSRISA